MNLKEMLGVYRCLGLSALVFEKVDDDTYEEVLYEREMKNGSLIENRKVLNTLHRPKTKKTITKESEAKYIVNYTNYVWEQTRWGEDEPNSYGMVIIRPDDNALAQYRQATNFFQDNREEIIYFENLYVFDTDNDVFIKHEKLNPDKNKLEPLDTGTYKYIPTNIEAQNGYYSKVLISYKADLKFGEWVRQEKEVDRLVKPYQQEKSAEWYELKYNETYELKDIRAVWNDTSNLWELIPHTYTIKHNPHKPSVIEDIIGTSGAVSGKKITSYTSIWQDKGYMSKFITTEKTETKMKPYRVPKWSSVASSVTGYYDRVRTHYTFIWSDVTLKWEQKSIDTIFYIPKEVGTISTRMITSKSFEEYIINYKFDENSEKWIREDKQINLYVSPEDDYTLEYEQNKIDNRELDVYEWHFTPNFKLLRWDKERVFKETIKLSRYGRYHRVTFKEEQKNPNAKGTELIYNVDYYEIEWVILQNGKYTGKEKEVHKLHEYSVIRKEWQYFKLTNNGFNYTEETHEVNQELNKDTLAKTEKDEVIAYNRMPEDTIRYKNEREFNPKNNLYFNYDVMVTTYKWKGKLVGGFEETFTKTGEKKFRKGKIYIKWYDLISSEQLTRKYHFKKYAQVEVTHYGKKINADGTIKPSKIITTLLKVAVPTPDGAFSCSGRNRVINYKRFLATLNKADITKVEVKEKNFNRNMAIYFTGDLTLSDIPTITFDEQSTNLGEITGHCGVIKDHILIDGIAKVDIEDIGDTLFLKQENNRLYIGCLGKATNRTVVFKDNVQWWNGFIELDRKTGELSGKIDLNEYDGYSSDKYHLHYTNYSFVVVNRKHIVLTRYVDENDMKPQITTDETKKEVTIHSTLAIHLGRTYVSPLFRLLAKEVDTNKSKENRWNIDYNMNNLPFPSLTYDKAKRCWVYDVYKVVGNNKYPVDNNTKADNVEIGLGFKIDIKENYTNEYGYTNKKYSDVFISSMAGGLSVRCGSKGSNILWTEQF